MLLTDKEIIEKFNINSDEKILDVGGSMTQHDSIRIDTLVDLIRPEEDPYHPSKLNAKKFVRLDITKEKLPFKDKEFDFCLCTHTLEDLATPFLIISEMSRVAKRGLIITPSMGEDMVFSPIDFTRWLTGAMRSPGQAHHKWFFINSGKEMKIIPKIYPILYTHDFHITGWSGNKEMIYPWNGKIRFDEFKSLSIHDLINEYEKFIKINRKFIKTGRVLYFTDNIFNLTKALTKKFLKRGVGYKYR